MNSDCAFIILTYLKELIQNCIIRCRTIDKVELCVIYSILYELLSVVLVRLIQSDDVRDSKVTEYFKVILRGITVLWLARNLLSVVYGAHECNKLSWNDPVKIAILDLFIVLILSRVKILKAIPPQLVRDL